MLQRGKATCANGKFPGPCGRLWCRTEALRENLHQTGISGRCPRHSALTVCHFICCTCSFFPTGSSSTHGFPGGSAVKNPPADAGDTGSIPGSGRSPGGGNGSPLQYSCLENPMDRGGWWATVHEVAKTERLNNNKLYKAACPWTPKQLSLPTFLRYAVKFSDSRPEAIKESFLSHP